MIKDAVFKISGRQWGAAALVLWAVAVFFLLQKGPYEVDEGAARGLLVVWSVVDHVVSPVMAFGMPDFRAIFFVPVGILWTGDIAAARVFTLLVMAIAIFGIYRWREARDSSEAPLLASGLLLISPLMIDQVNKIATGPYLLLCFMAGAWLNDRYRREPRPFGGVHFSQILLCVMTVSLHPAGLAYPAVLLWTWYKNPITKAEQRYFFAGTAAAVIIALLLTEGWHPLAWFQNPIRSLADIVCAPAIGDFTLTEIRAAAGTGMCLLLIAIVASQARQLWADFLGKMLLTGVISGLVLGDKSWAGLVLTLSLYWGFPILLQRRNVAGFLKQRGVPLALLFIIAMTFTFEDKLSYLDRQKGILSPSDELIKNVADNVDLSETASNPSAKRQAVRIISQWPWRTTLACRCDVLPLPPPLKEESVLVSILHGTDYLVFDPQDPRNRSLVRSLAVNENATETVAVQPAGVIVHVKSLLSAPNTAVQKSVGEP